MLLASYHYWGEACQEKFNGMWAFVIYDPKNQRIFASRDRFGIKPLYYSTIGNYFSLASEIKQFTAVPQWRSVLNNNMAMDYFYYGVVDHTSETMFKDVYQLSAGQSLIYCLNSQTYKVTQWYDKDRAVKPFEGNTEDAISEYRRILVDSVSLRLRSDVKVGSSLSGGIDSSSIVSIIAELLKCDSSQSDIQSVVSACYENKQYDERDYIDALVTKLKVNRYDVFPKFENLFSTIDTIIYHQDVPFKSLSTYASYNVYQEAALRKLTVMLDGQGPDELISGYLTSFYPFLSGLLSQRNWSQFFNELSAISNVHSCSYSKLAMISAFNYIFPQPVKATIKRYDLQKQYPWFKKDFVRHHYSEKQLSLVNADDLDGFLDNLFFQTSMPTILHILDRNSMSFSIESRVPFLDYRLVELSRSLNQNLKIRDGMTKYVLRHAMTGYLPERIQNRVDKKGFVTPEDQWIRSNKTLFKDQILSNLPPFIQKNIFEKWLVNTLEEVTLDDNRLWKLFCFQRWVSLFNVNFA